MTHERRIEIIKKIEKLRGSKIIVYVTGDRQGLETKISPDTFPFIEKQLTAFKNPKKIDLFIYSTGGVTMAGYSLVNMIREYASSFGVLIPFKALSCATLIALGADDIIMTKMGQLSPIDPSFTHPLGPKIQSPGQTSGQLVPVSVEDIFNFIDLARKELKIEDVDTLERVLQILSSSLHPLILGHGYRMREQAGFLADNVLSSHIEDKDMKKKIIDVVTKGRFSHDYIFNRQEAKHVMKLPIVEDEKIEKLLMELFREYQDSLELANPYNAESDLGAADEASKIYNRAIIESSVGPTYIFKTEKQLSRKTLQLPNMPISMPQIIEKVIKEGWVEDISL